jgi:DNA-binding beta-propeller fold protein YncE
VPAHRRGPRSALRSSRFAIAAVAAAAVAVAAGHELAAAPIASRWMSSQMSFTGTSLVSLMAPTPLGLFPGTASLGAAEGAPDGISTTTFRGGVRSTLPGPVAGAIADPGNSTMRAIKHLALLLHLAGPLLAACKVDGYYYPPDARIPIVDNGQPAELVLGQETFTSADMNRGGISARSLYWPNGVAVDEAGRLWVLDTGNSRALMWSTAPVTSFAAAALVVGSADFTMTNHSCDTPTSFIAPFAQLAAYSGKLLIPAAGCNRVMIWNPDPVTNGAAASTVLGQASFSGSSAGNGAADLSNPTGVWTDGIRVAVADSDNNRVLIWMSFPITNKEPADIVLGQQGFGTSGFPISPTGATMRHPFSVYSDGMRLFVSDALNHRVLVWRSFPTTSGQPADFAIGQPDLISDGTGQGASQLARPAGITTVGDHLFVADSENDRVLVYSPIPESSGASASFVIGQPNFETNYSGGPREIFSRPWSVAVGGNKLYVADFLNNRVLRFDLRL